MKKTLLIILAFVATALGINNQEMIVSGFNNVRGISNLSRTHECATYVIPELASTSIDWGNSCVQRLLRNENLTITSFSGGDRYGQMSLVLLASTSSPGTITWPASVKWASASQSAPTLSGANRVDIIRFYAVASGSYYGVYGFTLEGAPQ